MNKKITWKQSLLIAFILYAVKFMLGNILPLAVVAALEIGGLFTLIFGIFGGIRAMFYRKKKS